jgi:hypothetical protein
MDDQDHPHAFFWMVDPNNSAQCNLAHAWFDGTSWQQDSLSGGPSNLDTGADFSAALDHSGTPQILIYKPISSIPMNVDTVHFIHKVAGAWSDDSLASLGISGSYLRNFALCLDPSGSPHFLLQVNDYSVQNLHVVHQDSQGIWTDSHLNSIPSSDISGHWKDRDNAIIFYESAPLGFWVTQEASGVWQSPAQISSDTEVAESIGSAHSADGSRIVAYRMTILGLKLYSQDGLGVWHETLIDTSDLTGQNIYISMIRIGVDGANKVHVLVQSSAGAYMDYHE